MNLNVLAVLVVLACVSLYRTSFDAYEACLSFLLLLLFPLLLPTIFEDLRNRVIFPPPDNNVVLKKKTRAVEIREGKLLLQGSVGVSVWKRSRGEP